MFTNGRRASKSRFPHVQAANHGIIRGIVALELARTLALRCQVDEANKLFREGCEVLMYPTLSCVAHWALSRSSSEVAHNLFCEREIADGLQIARNDRTDSVSSDTFILRWKRPPVIAIDALKAFSQFLRQCGSADKAAACDFTLMKVLSHWSSGAVDVFRANLADAQAAISSLMTTRLPWQHAGIVAEFCHNHCHRNLDMLAVATRLMDVALADLRVTLVSKFTSYPRSVRDLQQDAHSTGVRNRDDGFSLSGTTHWTKDASIVEFASLFPTQRCLCMQLVNLLFQRAELSILANRLPTVTPTSVVHRLKVNAATIARQVLGACRIAVVASYGEVSPHLRFDAHELPSE